MFRSFSRLFVVLLVALPMLVPPLVFIMVALAEGMSIAETVNALIEQYRSDRNNLLVVGALGLFPVILLLIVLWIYYRVSKNERYLSAMGWGGLLPVAAVLLWVNFEFWPGFLPTRVFRGFPHGLEFIIGPGFFAPIGMLVGIVVSWFIARKST